jgi:hypothetical protein
MRKYFWKTVGRIIAVGIGMALATSVWWEGFVTEDYSAVCTRCLQEVHGVDKYFLGIHYSHTEKLAAENGEVFDPPRPPRPSPTSPDTDEQIFGTPCEHHYVRIGFGRECGGLISDGRYSHPPGIYVRLDLIKRLFETYHRIPNRTLAQETYSMIDQDYPENMGWDVRTPLPSVLIAEAVPNEPMSILYRGLPLLHTKEDWRTLLDAAKAHDGSLLMLKNSGNGN